MTKLNTEPKPYPTHLVGQQFTSISRSVFEILLEPPADAPKPHWYELHYRQGFHIAFVRCISKLAYTRTCEVGGEAWTLIAPQTVEDMEHRAKREAGHKVEPETNTELQQLVEG